MSTYEDLLAECRSFAREVERLKNVNEWLDGAQDIDFVCGACHEYKSARLYVAIGGPAIYIDTRTDTVEGRWVGDTVSVPCDTKALDDALRDYWECAA